MNDIFKTTDLHLATFMKLNGAEYIGVEDVPPPNIKGACNFMFRKGLTDFKDIIDAFHKSVAFRDGLYQYRFLKTELSKHLNKKRK